MLRAVVDDDIDLLGSLADFLGREGMAVSVLHEVRSLGEHIKRDPPDLIVLDPIMQGLNGLAALSTLRAAGNTVPVILTSGADDMDRIVGLEMGADDCIGKPDVAATAIANPFSGLSVRFPYYDNSDTGR